MSHTELVISFGDLQPITLNTATQDGLVITESPDKIVIQFVGPDPTFFSRKLERFLRRGVVIMAKRNNDPRRKLRGALLLLDETQAIIELGKHPIGLDIDAPAHEEQQPTQTLEQAEGSLVAQLLAKLDKQNSRIAELEENQKDVGQVHLEEKQEELKVGKSIATEDNTQQVEFDHADVKSVNLKKTPKQYK